MSPMSDQVVAALRKHPQVAYEVWQALGGVVFLTGWKTQLGKEVLVSKPPGKFTISIVETVPPALPGWHYTILEWHQGGWSSLMEGFSAGPVEAVKRLIEAYVDGESCFVRVPE